MVNHTQSSDRSLQIRFAYYSRHHLKHIQPAILMRDHCTPWDVSFNLGNPLLEYGLFVKLLDTWNDTIHYKGIWSWKALRKSRVDLNYLSSQIDIGVRQAHEAIIFNPAIGNNAVFENMWAQAIAVGHPGFEKLMTKLSLSHLVRKILPVSSFAACSYIIGTRSFWSDYLDYIDASLNSFDELAENDSEFDALYFGSAGYHRDPELDYRPFIIERLLQMYLVSRQIDYYYIPPTHEWFVTKFGSLGDELFELYKLKQKAFDDDRAAKLWRERRDRFCPFESDTFFDILCMDDPEIDLG